MLHLDGVQQGALSSSADVAEARSSEKGYPDESTEDAGVYPNLNDDDWEKHGSNDPESGYRGEDLPVGVYMDIGVLQNELTDPFVLLKLQS